MEYVVFYDLDHTILSSSSGTLIIKDLYAKNVLSLFQVINGMILSSLYRINFIDTESLIAKWVKKLKGMDVSLVEQYSFMLFEEQLQKYIYPQALESIYTHKAKGGIIVLLSASLDFICKPVLQLLAFDEVLCTQLEVIDGKYTGFIKGKYCYGEEKLVRALHFCHMNNYDISQAYYYADSAADIPVLEKVGYPQCVNPQKGLLKEALKRGWPVHNW